MISMAASCLIPSPYFCSRMATGTLPLRKPLMWAVFAYFLRSSSYFFLASAPSTVTVSFTEDFSRFFTSFCVTIRIPLGYVEFRFSWDVKQVTIRLNIHDSQSLENLFSDSQYGKCNTFSEMETPFIRGSKEKRRSEDNSDRLEERETGFEPATSTLARWSSTTELLSQNYTPWWIGTVRVTIPLREKGLEPLRRNGTRS